MLDDTALKAVTAKLLLDSMSAEDREQLLTKAIGSLFDKNNPSNYHDTRTRIQVVFDDQVRVVAANIVAEYFKTPEVQERVRSVLSAAVGKAFDTGIIDELAKRMTSRLWDDR